MSLILGFRFLVFEIHIGACHGKSHYGECQAEPQRPVEGGENRHHLEVLAEDFALRIGGNHVDKVAEKHQRQRGERHRQNDLLS